MTPDPDAAATFYQPVVGWKVSSHADPQAGGVDYRHIARSDGGSAGGVLRLTQEMTDHGAMPVLGRLPPCRRCRYDSGGDRSRRRQGDDAGDGPAGRPHGHGHRSPGRAVLCDDAGSAARAARCAKRRVFDRPARARALERAAHQRSGSRPRLLREAFRHRAERRNGHGRDGQVPLHRQGRHRASVQ